MKNKKGFYKVLFLVAGVLVLAFMVYKIGLDTIWHGLMQIGWSFWIIMAIWLVIYTLNAASWDIIIKSEVKENRPSFLHVLRLTISGFAVNYITPGVSLGGEPYKVLELKDSMGTHRATSTVLLYSMMHIFTHITFWIISVVIAFFYLELQWLSAVLLGLLLVVLMFMIFMFLQAYKRGLVVAIVKVAAKIPFLKHYIRKFIQNHEQSLVEIDNQIANLHNESRVAFYKSFLVELISRFVGCLELYVIMWALGDMFPGMEVNFIDSIIITAGYSLFVNAVFFIPLQIGSREGGYMLAFEAIGLASAPAMIVGLVTRIRELFWILIGLLLMRVKKMKNGKDD